MDTSKVTRLEIIGPGGREVIRYSEIPGVEIHLQDDDRTLKLFVPEEVTLQTWLETNPSNLGSLPDVSALVQRIKKDKNG